LTNLELGEQLKRYRAIREGGEVIQRNRRTLVIRVAAAVPEILVDRLVEVERACCPFFTLSWDRASRCLAISVSAREEEPALDAIGHALGVGCPLHS
jgi:hypothetical protein